MYAKIENKFWKNKIRQEAKEKTTQLSQAPLAQELTGVNGS